MTKPKTKTVNDFSRCLDPLDMDATLIAVIEMSQSSWLVAGIVPGVEREPLKKLAIDEHALLNLLRRWRAEAEKQGHRDHTDRRRVRGRTRRLLASALARRAGRRGSRYSCIERCGDARTSPSEDRSARHGGASGKIAMRSPRTEPSQSSLAT